MVFGSTSMKPRSETFTPASAAPRSSVTGRRPIETSTWSTSILSEPLGVSNGTTTPEPVCSSEPTRASPCTVRPRRVSERARMFATSRSGPSGRIGLGRASSSVVFTPRSV